MARRSPIAASLRHVGRAIASAFDPRTRATRSGFLILGALLLLVDLALESVLFGGHRPLAERFRDGSLAVNAVNAVAALLYLAIVVRRAHDFGSPGWPWALLVLLVVPFNLMPGLRGHGDGWPFVIAAILMGLGLLTLSFRPGMPGTNPYGPDPRFRAVRVAFPGSP